MTTLYDNDPYLDLLEKTLLHWFWPQDHIDWHGKPQSSPVSNEELENGNCWPQFAFTMINRTRLRLTRDLCRKSVENNIPGGFAECGVWRGGSCIYARACLPMDRQVYVCDSFCGFPPYEPEKQYIDLSVLSVSLEAVKSNFEKFGLNQNVHFVPGYFRDSLPGFSGDLAVLRLDGDTYQNYLDCLTFLWPKLSSGGFLICDEYCLEETKRAVRDYLGTSPTLTSVDSSCAWMQKP